MKSVTDTLELDHEEATGRHSVSQRLPIVGDTVHYWPPGTGDIGPAEEPLHAKVAKVLYEQDGNKKFRNQNGACTLAVLSSIGTWQSKPASKFSPMPKTGCWTWPR